MTPITGFLSPLLEMGMSLVGHRSAGSGEVGTRRADLYGLPMARGAIPETYAPRMFVSG